jgi:hypothetical protein
MESGDWMITVFFPTFSAADNSEVITPFPHTFHFAETLTTDQTEIPVSAVLGLPLPPTNLYFMAIMRIHNVKYGPFHEHSSQLYSIAAGVPNWGKVNSGMFKMYEVCTTCSLLEKRRIKAMFRPKFWGSVLLYNISP